MCKSVNFDFIYQTIYHFPISGYLISDTASIGMLLSAKMFFAYPLFARGEGNEGMRKVTRQPDGQPIEARPGFFLREMGQNLLTRIGSDATTKISNMKFKGSTHG